MKIQLVSMTLFTALVAWFHGAQPYSTYMERADQWQLVGYHCARIVFALWFALIIFGIGARGLRWLGRHQAMPELVPLDEIILCLLVGLAVIRPLMLVLGFAYLYTLWVLLPLAVLGLWWAWPQAGQLCGKAVHGYADWLRQQSAAEKLLLITATFTALAAIMVLLASKLFFPLADPDYLDHYLNYYVRVVEDGFLWPEHAWPHFYVTKGGSEIFFAVALSDALAPFAVNMLMVMLCFAMTYSLAYHATHDRLAAWAACTMAAVAFLPLTPGVAEFCKQHIIGGTLLLGLVWISQHSLMASPHIYRHWRTLLIGQSVAIALFRPTFAAIACGYGLLIICYALIAHKREGALSHTLMVIASIVAVGLILGFNQLTTGLADATPFRLFFGFADQEHVARWFSPFWLLVCDLGSSPQLSKIAIPDLPRLLDTVRILRLHELNAYAALGYLPILAAALLAFWQLYAKHREHSARVTPMICMIALLVSAGVASLFIRQDISLVRAYIFCAFAVAILGAFPFGLVRHLNAHRFVLHCSTGIFMTVLCILAILQALDSIPNRHLRDMARLATGKLTMGTLYTRDYPHWPDYAEACRHLPPHTRVWTSRYMPTPGCRAENFFYFSMGTQWHTVLFGPANIAIAALQLEGLDYFLIDTNDPFFDLLPYAPLFRPDQIVQHFGVLWQRDGVYLLTWKSPAIAELPPEFIPAYSESVHRSLRAADFPAIYAQMSRIYQEWKLTQHWPVHIDPTLPRPRGWQ